MKKLMLTLAFISTSALSQNIPKEKDHTISELVTDKQVQALAAIVRLNGYSCKSISSARPLIMSDGWYISCNNYNYEYEVFDKGGKFQVKVK